MKRSHDFLRGTIWLADVVQRKTKMKSKAVGGRSQEIDYKQCRCGRVRFLPGQKTEKGIAKEESFHWFLEGGEDSAV